MHNKIYILLTDIPCSEVNKISQVRNVTRDEVKLKLLDRRETDATINFHETINAGIRNIPLESYLQNPRVHGDRATSVHVGHAFYKFRAVAKTLINVTGKW